MDLRELPHGWQLRQLSEICETATGGTPSRTNPGYFKGSIPWVKSGELEDERVLDTEERLTQAAITESSAKIFPKGTVLMAMYGATIGKLGKLGMDATTNQAVCVFFPAPCLDKDYLFHYLRTIRPRLLNDSFGGAQPNISQTFIRKLPVPVPPIAEQYRIVAQIEELTFRLEKARGLHAQAVDDARRLFQLGLERVFSARNIQDWPTYSARRLFTAVKGQVDPKEGPYIDMPHVGPDSIESGTGRLLRERIKTPRELGLRSGKYLFSREHVIYSKIRPALRKVALPDFSGVCSADMYPLLPNADVISREFLALSLLAPPFSQYAIDNSDRNAMPKINRRVLFAYEMAVPDQDMQNAIVKQLFGLHERAEQLASLQAQVSQELDRFLPAVLAKAFRGEL